MRIALAATHHDPDGRLYEQTARLLPRLREFYAHMAIFATPTTQERTHSLLRSAGAVVEVGTRAMPTGHLHLGLWRRMALALALRSDVHAAHIHFCDLDRVLHWAEYYGEELRSALMEIDRYDCTVFGRTARAFESHPRVQRDTEAIANTVFGLVSGQPWDVMTASRGFSRQAAELIVNQCQDDTVGSDCSWPLLIKTAGQMTLGYRETEGLEFETLDRFSDEIAALGGRDAWIARMDGESEQWLVRLKIAQAEVTSALSYSEGGNR